jgi:hypothetical protein
LAEPTFKVAITNDSVTASLDVSSHSPRTRFYAGSGYFLLALVADCAFFFVPRKHGRPSMWHYLSSSSVVESGNSTVAVLLLLAVPLFMYITCRRYIWAAYPLDEKPYCDGSTLTISKIRWLDFRNADWRSRRYALTDVSDIKYCRVARLRGSSIYGLRVIAKGRRERILPGLDEPSGEKILSALKALGGKVSDD